jgi:membrane protein
LRITTKPRVDAVPVVRRVGAMLVAAGKEFLVDGGPRLGAALSYYTLFSLVPLLFLAVAVAGFIFGDPDAVSDAVDRATEVAGAEVGESLESLLATVQKQRGGALSIGIALSAFAAASVFQQVQAVLAILFHIPERKRREGPVGWLIRRLIGVASAIGLAVLVLTPVAAVGGINWLIDLLPDDVGPLPALLGFAIPVVSVVLLMLVTGFTFQVLTAIEIPWRAALRGGATTALLGLTAAYGVGMYLNTAGDEGTLGALGGVAILLFFFNLMWFVYLYGAEVTKVYSDYLHFGDVRQPSEREEVPVAATSAPASVVSPSPPRTGSFLSGAAVGWLLGRSSRK